MVYLLKGSSATTITEIPRETGVAAHLRITMVHSVRLLLQHDHILIHSSLLCSSQWIKLQLNYKHANNEFCLSIHHTNYGPVEARMDVLHTGALCPPHLVTACAIIRSVQS